MKPLLKPVILGLALLSLCTALIHAEYRLTTVATGRQPKQVVYSPDGRYIYATLLDGRGFSVYDTQFGGPARLIEVEGFAARLGFVEGLFLPDKPRFLVSQMTTNRVHEYDVSDPANPVYLRSIPTQGEFPKVMAYHAEKSWLAVSNWVSSSVVILDYDSGEPIKVLRGLKTPRGLLFDQSGSRLIIASYDGGFVSILDTQTWTETARYESKGSNMRHMVVSPDETMLYVSDMAKARVLELSLPELLPHRVFATDLCPNTIEIDSTGHYLYISCRGPNAAGGYMQRSPRSGQVHVYDLQSSERIAVIVGGNQPTGLDLSPDGTTLVFSNFLDHNMELWPVMWGF